MVRDGLAQVLILGDSARHFVVGRLAEQAWETLQDGEISAEVRVQHTYQREQNCKFLITSYLKLTLKFLLDWTRQNQIGYKLIKTTSSDAVHIS